MMKEIADERESGIALNLQELLIAYIRRWWVIAISMALLGGLVLTWTLFCVTPMYRASVTIYVNNNSTSVDKEDVSASDLSAATYLVKTYMNLTKSNRVLTKVAAALDDEYGVGQLKGMISTSQIESTGIYSIYVTHKDPEETARIANIVADVAPLEIQSMAAGTSAYVIDWASVPGGRYSPNYSRNAVLGAAVGLLLSVAYLTIAYLKDTRIKDENDLADMFDVPILGRIPDFEYAQSGSHHSYETKTNG
ncbi:MAG: hypothetical protein E7462_00810 [Ruminococcaceae bacterium]|nr:hypothetical protein [Oscillospiraceae bacterium]